VVPANVTVKMRANPRRTAFDICLSAQSRQNEFLSPFPERLLIDTRVFIRAFIVGVVLEIALMIATHFIPFIERQGFLLGGMTISAVAGYLYAMDTGKGYFTSATMAAIVGGAAALIGVGISVAMRDAPTRVVPLFTTICVVTGAVGGLFGQMSANLKKMGR
jgi:hypothetical protein